MKSWPINWLTSWSLPIKAWNFSPMIYSIKTTRLTSTHWMACFEIKLSACLCIWEDASSWAIESATLCRSRAIRLARGLSVYFCHKHFNLTRVKAITFEGFGSLEFIRQLNAANPINLAALDIKTYLIVPNFFNACNTHLGKIINLNELELDSNDRHLFQWILSFR